MSPSGQSGLQRIVGVVSRYMHSVLRATAKGAYLSTGITAVLDHCIPLRPLRTISGRFVEIAADLRDGALVMVAVDLEFSHDRLLSLRSSLFQSCTFRVDRPAARPWAFGVAGICGIVPRTERRSRLESGEVVSERPQE